MSSKKNVRYKIKFPKKMDKVLNYALLAFMVFGFIVSTSASITTSTTLSSTFRNIVKLAVIDLGGLLLYFTFAHLHDYKNIANPEVYSRIFIGTIIFLLSAVFCCLVQGSINGSYAWLYIGSFPVTLQPAEFAKISTIIAIAFFLSDRSFRKIENSFDAIKKPVTHIIIYVAIIALLQRDLGSAVVVTLIAMVVFLVPANKALSSWQILDIVGLFSVVILYGFCLTESGQELLAHISVTAANRFSAVTNPSYGSDATREIFYSLLGISKGGIFGVGLGESVQKFGYLVSSDADYIFSVICEEHGLLGIFTVFGFYIVILWRLIYFSLKVEHESDKVILVGTASYIFIHCLLNIGGVSGLLPLTGVPLLLLSKGGSATFSIMILLGMSQGAINNYQVACEQKRQVIR